MRSASEHRMVSAVLAAHEAGALQLSSDGATTMAVEALAQRHLHLQLWAGLDVVRQALAPFGAEVAVLKGIATEGRWYAQLGERTCTDLDLLLDPAAQPDTASIVAALDPQRGASGAIHWLVRRRLLQHVDLRVGAIPVDLHLDPLKIGIPTRQLDAVWATTEVLQTPHGSLRVLSPEIELILLLLHLNKDGFALLGPFLDVARILERGALDWDALRAFVRGEGLDVPVWKSLGLVATVLELQVAAPKVGGPRGWTWDRLWARTALRGDRPLAASPRSRSSACMPRVEPPTTCESCGASSCRPGRCWRSPAPRTWAVLCAAHLRQPPSRNAPVSGLAT